jgi:hypothetical protein
MTNDEGWDRIHGAADAEYTRTCTCHPDDAPVPCPRKFATHHCWRAAVYDETRRAVVNFKNTDISPAQQRLLDYLKRVERALDGTF